MIRLVRPIGLAVWLALVAGSALAAPSPSISQDIQERVRHEVGKRAVRLGVEQGVYELEGIRLDDAGVSFAPETQQPLGRWSGGEKQSPPPLTSPVSWDRIHTIDAKHNGATRGALVGAVVLPLTVLVWPHGNYSDDWTTAYALVAIPAGALTGALVGAMIPDWVRVWPRNEALGEPARR